MGTFSISEIGIYDESLSFNEQEGPVIEYAKELMSGTASNIIYETYGGSKRMCCKEYEDLDKNIKVIVHVDEGNNNAKFRTFFDNATAQNVKYDIIGLSYYPYWIKKDYTETIADLEFNLNDMVKRYNKDVMIVEVGGEADKVQNTYELLKATIEAVKKVPNNRGLGVMYWDCLLYTSDAADE